MDSVIDSSPGLGSGEIYLRGIVKGKLILSVDGVKTNRMVLRRILSDCYDVIEADNGKTALGLLRAYGAEISVVMLDLHVPVMDGMMILKEMSSDPVLSWIPVIATAVDPDPGTEACALSSGAWDIIKKPFVPIIVQHRVKNVLDIKENSNLRQRIAQLQEREMGQRQIALMADNITSGVSMDEILDGGCPRNLYRNSRFCSMLGFPVDDKSDGMLLRVCEDDSQREMLSAAYRHDPHDKEPLNLELKLRRPDGSRMQVTVRMNHVPYEGASNPVMMVILDDVTTERIQRENERIASEKIRYYAEMDSTTGVYNRRRFCQLAHQVLAANPDGDYIIVCSDIRNFRALNELLGVSVCDRILVAVGHMLESLLPDGVALGRIGTDNFAFCIAADKLDVPLLERNSEQYYADIAGGVTIRLKFGICRIDDKSIPVEILCDRVAQVAKSLDSDIFKSVAWYSQEIKSTMLLEQRLAEDMKEGLEKEQFAVFLQPIVNCEDGVISGSEALVRWFHPTLGLIAPNSFIPLFERNGLIIQLDKYMVEQICRLLALRIESGGPLTYISVNLSMRTIFGCDIVRFLSETVDRHGLDRSLLRLEITESVVARNQAQFNSIIGRLHKAGFCVMMDDFGSEYSSLNALMSLEFDVIKLDMKFIKDYSVSEKSRSILEAILMMARWIGVATVVEGVETSGQLEFLYSLGCDQVQGFYYSKPLPAKEFFEFQDMFTPVRPSRP